MAEAVRNAAAFGAMTQIAAVAAATLAPARLLGVESERGTLRPGARADLVVLAADGAPAETWLAGRRAWPLSSPS
jgi:N-acetylglucosamine-6-phosphate deacetylase